MRAVTVLLLFLACSFLVPVETGYAGTGGIQPVSPEELAVKVSGFLDSLHEQGKPLVAQVSKIIIAITGILLLLVCFTGLKIMIKAVVALLAVGLGLFLYFNAETVVAIYLWYANNFMGS